MSQFEAGDRVVVDCPLQRCGIIEEALATPHDAQAVCEPTYLVRLPWPGYPEHRAVLRASEMVRVVTNTP